MRSLLRRFAEQRAAVASLAFLVLLALLAVAAPLVARALGADMTAVDLYHRFAGPSLAHPLGTDELGRDVLVRLLYGAQVSLAVGLIGALAASIIGTLVGLGAGLAGGRIDSILMRFTDGVIALPLLPLLIVLAAADPTKLGLPAEFGRGSEGGLLRIGIIVALVGWTTVARLVRGAALSLREREFVLAAEAQGASRLRIAFVHLLPNAAGPIVAATALAVGNVIMIESVLSFLGLILLESTLSFLSLGVQPPAASWGNMLTNAQDMMLSAPALALYPGLLILATVVACNVAGDGIEAALDPRAEAARD
jgi:peptide/nickel transport system permease protein